MWWVGDVGWGTGDGGGGVAVGIGSVGVGGESLVRPVGGEGGRWTGLGFVRIEMGTWSLGVGLTSK